MGQIPGRYAACEKVDKIGARSLSVTPPREPFMRAEQHPLWEKLRKYDFGGTASREQFVARLARDRQWSLVFAERTVDEYLRFIFLGCVGDAPCCPSDDVDQAWHLHLTYTREYWSRFCGEILGTPFHHTPAAHGGAERDKHVAMYRDTLAAYVEWFGRRPPTDIWPSVERRFPPASSVDRLNGVGASSGAGVSSRTWAATAASALGVPLLVLLMVNGGLANPWEFAGPKFLRFFWTSLIPAIVFGVALRAMVRPPRAVFGEAIPPLSGYETAYLWYGPSNVAYASIAALVHRGTLHFDSKHRTLIVLGEPPPNDPIARTVVESAAAGWLPSQIVRIVRPLCVPIENRLVDAGLLTPRRVRYQVRFLSAVPVLVLLAMGCAKIWIGIERHRPITLLVVGCVVAAIAAFILTGLDLKRSHQGNRVLTALRRERKALKTEAYAAESGYEHDALVAAFGLFGLTALYGTPTGPLRSYLRGAPADAGAMGASSSGCGGGGGGGCGGGGCGGGGCGGCGGG
jgi:uncharacterized protein (TIGR04222 family)